MTSLSFSLKRDALIRLHDALACLGKFSETVSMEAEYDQLRLSALNSTKTAYASFVFDADKFFSLFSFSIRKDGPAVRRPSLDRFGCQIYIKALLSVFKGRTNESRDKDKGIERCEVELQDAFDQTKCRLVIKMICGHGVIKSYKLTYESTLVQHAVFDRSGSRNQWTIESKFLREILEHFSAPAEQLDMYFDGRKAVFTSFTTKVTHGKEILKQPIHTSVAIDTKDFEAFIVEEDLHVAINVKDFKAVIVHADASKSAITARYTRPCRPLQLAYGSEGMTCEFTLMTRGEGLDDISSQSQPVPELSARLPPGPAQTTSSKKTPAREDMPTPSIKPVQCPDRTTAQKKDEPRHQLGSAYMDVDSLFVPVDDDRQWGESNYKDDEEDRLGWDASVGMDEPNETVAHCAPERGVSSSGNRSQEIEKRENEPTLPPTQRISQIRDLGLFD